MTSALPYSDRAEAGRVLADELGRYKGASNVVVMGLARGGVAVAAEVARALHLPLDALAVRKLSLPSEPEFALGAITSDGTLFLEADTIERLGIAPGILDSLGRKIQLELQRRGRLYRSGGPPITVKGRTIVLVDDGLATGSTMIAAAHSIRKQEPARIVAASPVGSREAIRKVRAEVDECVCPAIPEWFYAVGEWYEFFPQLSDSDVVELLEANRREMLAHVSTV